MVQDSSPEFMFKISYMYIRETAQTHGDIFFDRSYLFYKDNYKDKVTPDLSKYGIYGIYFTIKQSESY